MDDNELYHTLGDRKFNKGRDGSSHHRERGEVGEREDGIERGRVLFSCRIDTMLVETLDLKGIPPSQIPGRPKKWRSKCIEILETSISNK